MKKTIKLVSIATVLILCVSFFYGCASTEATATSVIGTWVSYDWGEYENSCIILTINADGTGSRYFYHDINSYEKGQSPASGKKGWTWDCKGAIVICDIGNENEFKLEYNSTNDTLVEQNGRNIKTFTRAK